jgi:hypothetical protein
MTIKMYAEASRRSLTIALGGLIAIAMLAAPGCQDYKWRWDYQKAEQEAREQGKYLFVFYKWWLSDASNQMHGNVLPDPAVGALFQDTINLLLEKDSSTEYANYLSRYGVTSPPAFVLVAPDGTYYVASGFLPKERFIDFVKNAKEGRSPGSRQPPSKNK